MPKQTEKQTISYSCYYTQNREGEQFVEEHVFSYQISGSLTLDDGRQRHVFNPGDFRFIKRNQLVKFVKEPPVGGEFRSISVYFDQQFLRTLSVEYDLKASVPLEREPMIRLEPRPLLKTYVDSLVSYQQSGLKIDNRHVEVKLREGILLLLACDPELKSVLFDFSDPSRIDLKAFMEKNFHFNVQLQRFAYLTGRSLATFKRDFSKLYTTSPSKWLQQRRLQEAYYQLKENGKSPSEIYLDLGFEDLSHFSYAFKNRFGIAPSKL